MTTRQRQLLVFVAALVGAALLTTGSPARTSHAVAHDFPETAAGDPLPGLSPQLQALFQEGQDVFTHEFTPAEGLGPIYNERACQTCHGGPDGAVGGPDPVGVGSTFNVTHFGYDQGGYYNALRQQGGPVIQHRDISSQVPGCPIVGETVPPNATVHSIRHTPAVWGFGLLDAIPDSEILERENLGVDGIRGFANWGREPQGRASSGLLADPQFGLFGSARVGRFGWRAQTGTLEQFSADPFDIELGVTNLLFPQEFTPAGLRLGSALPPGCQVAPSPNDTDQHLSYALYHFQALLAPPPQLRPTRVSRIGEDAFDDIGCSNCHVPEMRTSRRYFMELTDGSSIRVPQLENQRVHLYSDLLVHDMGDTLADDGGTTVGRVMGRAGGGQWRTTPLWGLRFKHAYLHDGRTASVRDAILAHGGEASISRQRFEHLSPYLQNAILEFLNRI